MQTHSIPKCTKNPISINNYFSKLGENDEPIYKNKKCTIRKGALYVKLCFFKIAVRSAIRSTLLTTERLATASEGRTSYIAFGNSRAGGVSNWCARVPSSLVLSVAQKVQDITTIRKKQKTD